MGKIKHTVGDGDWLAKIAFKYNADEKKVWEYSGNRSIRNSTPNPNALCRDAIIQIPDSAKKEENAAIDVAHKFVVPVKPKAQLHLKLQQFMEKPFEDDYELEIGGKKFTGKSTGGEIKVDIPIESHVGLLRFPKCGVELEIHVGELREAVPWQNNRCKISGAQRRMHNLAFNPKTVDGTVDNDTRDATGRFQDWADVYSPGNGLAAGDLSRVDKKLGPKTAGCLKKIHGV